MYNYIKYKETKKANKREFVRLDEKNKVFQPCIFNRRHSLIIRTRKAEIKWGKTIHHKNCKHSKIGVAKLMLNRLQEKWYFRVKKDITSHITKTVKFQNARSKTSKTE